MEIENRQEELDILYEKRSNALMLESKLEWFTGQLVTLNDFNPTFDRTVFREDIFKQINGLRTYSSSSLNMCKIKGKFYVSLN